MDDEMKTIVKGSVGGAVFLGGLLVSGCWAYPNYKVWEREKAGQAELAQASANRQIKVQEAKAAEEAAKSLAEAEIIRAGGVAKANQIIGDSLRGNEVYLHYLWIHGLQEGKNDVIYVPTEAGLPILEAGRRARPEPEKK